MICLKLPSASQHLQANLQARAKLNAFEYGNKVSTESNNRTKRLNWSPFEEAPYRTHLTETLNQSTTLK